MLEFNSNCHLKVFAFESAVSKRNSGSKFTYESIDARLLSICLNTEIRDVPLKLVGTHAPFTVLQGMTEIKCSFIGPLGMKAIKKPIFTRSALEEPSSRSEYQLEYAEDSLAYKKKAMKHSET